MEAGQPSHLADDMMQLSCAQEEQWDKCSKACATPSNSSFRPHNTDAVTYKPAISHTTNIVYMSCLVDTHQYLLGAQACLQELSILNMTVCIKSGV